MGSGKMGSHTEKKKKKKQGIRRASWGFSLPPGLHVTLINSIGCVTITRGLIHLQRFYLFRSIQVSFGKDLCAVSSLHVFLSMRQ